MSWLARSLADSLRLDDDGEAENDVVPTNNDNSEPPPISPTATATKPDENKGSDIESDEAETRGVKDDLDEFKQTLTRQFWGVASFLAPPPEDHPSSSPPDRPSPHFDRSEPPDRRPDQSAMAFDEDEEEEEMEECAVGVTDEVLAFAKNIAMHPETWLDFPLDEEEDLGDFDMCDAQQEHAMAIEHYAPRLAALRIELCPCHMSESYFWKVYFVLLHSRLNKQDAEILSTPQVMEARTKWMQELQCQTASEHDQFGRNTSFLKDSSSILHEDYEPVSSCSVYYEDKLLRTHPYESTTSPTAYETEKHLDESNEMPFMDKSVIEEKPITKTEDKNLTVAPSSKILDTSYEDDEDDWLEEDFDGYGGTATHVVNEEDISFSDLEDDDFIAPTKLKTVPKE